MTESMKTIGIAAFLLLLMSCPPLADSAEESHQTPNIILLVMDNFGYAPYGQNGCGLQRASSKPNNQTKANDTIQ